MTSGVEREDLRAELLGLGFDVVRFARIGGPAPGADQLDRWLEAGMHAGMAWLQRNADKRRQPGLVLEGARTVVALGVNYLPRPGPGDPVGGHPDAPGGAPGGAPAWARYALYQDYHDTITPALALAGRVLERRLGLGPADHRYYVDTGPVLERGWAAAAGAGFVGKNAMLISRDFGNWLLLSAILVRHDIEADAPLTSRSGSGEPGSLCGRCTRCLEACPTRAITAPGVVDARLCLSYLTIENKGAIPEPLRPAVGDRIYGCDICAEVCPWNRFAREARSGLLASRDAFSRLGLDCILKLDTAGFAEVFRGTPVKRIKRAGLLRNACVVAGNTGAPALLPQLDRLAADPAETELVREHAAWGAARIRARTGGGGQPGSAPSP